MADQFYYNNVYFNAGDSAGTTADIYEARAGVSIENNLFYANFFLVKNGVVVKTLLGEAEYRIFDRDRALVSGLNESNLTADSEGIYKITPVAATNLDDLNHYLLEVTISFGGQDRVNYIPIGIVE